MPFLPNAELAYIPPEKLAGYALNPEHPVGKHKAAVFESVLGMTAKDANELEIAILKAVKENEAKPTRLDEYGQRYEVEFDFERNGRKVVILTSWILETNETVPRLASCYIK